MSDNTGARRNFSWDEVPVYIPVDYKDYIGCSLTPVSNNIIEMHKLSLCANKIYALARKHKMKRIIVEEMKDKPGKGGFTFPVKEQRIVKVCYTCLKKTRFRCKKLGPQEAHVRCCMSYLNYWDSLGALVLKEKMESNR